MNRTLALSLALLAAPAFAAEPEPKPECAWTKEKFCVRDKGMIIETATPSKPSCGPVPDGFTPYVGGSFIRLIAGGCQARAAKEHGGEDEAKVRVSTTSATASRARVRVTGPVAGRRLRS